MEAEEKIILGWEQHHYALDDIELIAKGHNIIALARMIGNRTPITSNSEYKQICNHYNIYYSKVVLATIFLPVHLASPYF